MTCPHCWPPAAQRLAEANAATVARERDAALLARLLREGIKEDTKKKVLQ